MQTPNHRRPTAHCLIRVYRFNRVLLIDNCLLSSEYYSQWCPDHVPRMSRGYPEQGKVVIKSKQDKEEKTRLLKKYKTTGGDIGK